MKPRSLITLVLVLACTTLVARPLSAQKPAAAAKPAAAKPATPAAAAATTPPPAPAAPTKWAEPVKGTAVLQILKPDVKAGPKEVVTILKVKNMSYGPIAGLRVDEYWYDAKGGVIAGDSKRMKQLVQSGEVVTFELHTARDPKMQRNTYQFTHANGKVKVDSVKKFN
jgi:hypothetical protein